MITMFYGQTHRYKIGIKLDDNWSTLTFYPDNFTIPLSTPINVPLNHGDFSTANPNFNYSQLVGPVHVTWSI